MKPISLVVAGALVDAHGRVLVQRRPLAKQHGGLWEFPGGKVEAGETPETALSRELHEELGVVVELTAFVPVGFASVPPLLLLLYRCAAWSGDPVAGPGAALDWATLDSLTALAMPPADVPLVAALARSLRT